jgi:hypothetical protein
MSDTPDTKKLVDLLNQFETVASDIESRCDALQRRALSKRTRPFLDLYKTEVIVTRRKTWPSFSHSMMALNIHNPRTEMETIVDRDALKLARFLSKWTGLKTRVLDYRVDMGSRDGWRLHSGVIIGFRQDAKSILKNGLMGNEGIHKIIHQALANPEFWKELSTRHDFITKIGEIKLDTIAYSYNIDGRNFLDYKLDPRPERLKRHKLDPEGTLFYDRDGKLEMVIDSTALEINNNHALAGSANTLRQPKRPTPALKISGPSRDVK